MKIGIVVNTYVEAKAIECFLNKYDPSKCFTVIIVKNAKFTFTLRSTKIRLASLFSIFINFIIISILKLEILINLFFVLVRQQVTRSCYTNNIRITKLTSDRLFNIRNYNFDFLISPHSFYIKNLLTPNITNYKIVCYGTSGETNNFLMFNFGEYLNSSSLMSIDLMLITNNNDKSSALLKLKKKYFVLSNVQNLFLQFLEIVYELESGHFFVDFSGEIEDGTGYSRKDNFENDQKLRFVNFFKIYFGILVEAVSRKLFGLKQRWQIYYLDSAKMILEAVNNQPNKYYADPFILQSTNPKILVVEEFDKKTNKGQISILQENESTKNVWSSTTIIKEEKHLSFPSIFIHNEHFFILPERTKAGHLRLYKCLSFPTDWSPIPSGFEEMNLIDPVVFQYEGVWWLFGNRPPLGSLDRSWLLDAYFNHGDLITGKWTSHKQNPIKRDARGGRNAGRILYNQESLYRVGQDVELGRYGMGLIYFKIKHLDQEIYVEEEVESLCFKEQLFIGPHHFDRQKNMIVFDCARMSHFWK